jgi:hypothetical protein
MRSLSPTATALVAKIQEVVRKTSGSGSMVCPDVQSLFEDMSPADFNALNPPPCSQGFFTDDAAFCARLGGHIFGASPETINELPLNYYNILLNVVSQNFLAFLGAAIQDCTPGK